MSKGMTEPQKARLRGYLDSYKNGKPTCLLCEKGATDTFHTPEQTDRNGVPLPGLHLHVYGLCRKHAAQAEADALAEAAVEKLKSTYVGERVEKPKLMTVVFEKPETEEVKWAA